MFKFNFDVGQQQAPSSNTNGERHERVHSPASMVEAAGSMIQVCML